MFSAVLDIVTIDDMLLTMSPATLLSKIHEWGDPRTRDFPVILNPLFVFPMVLGYLYFVKVSGPRWMKNREPFRIINLIRFYNAVMVALNARFLYILLTATYLPGGHYSLWCQGITGCTDGNLKLAYDAASWYVLVRYADFLDTVFFVLRKKFTHITHLHVIHHTVVAVNTWFWVLFAPEGQPAFGLAINAFVHVVMYAYYFLTTLGPAVRQYLWWKRYLTTLQIVQFVIFIAHMSIPLFVDCGFPRHLIHAANAQTLLILCLFVNFYIKSYQKRRGPITTKEILNGTEHLSGRLANGKCD